MQKADSLEETLMLGKIEVKGKMGQQRMRLLDSIINSMDINLSSLVTQMVKKPPAMQKAWARSLGWEDPLEEGMATQSSVLAWGISMNRGAWLALQSMGHKESDTTEYLSTLGDRPAHGEGAGAVAKNRSQLSNCTTAAGHLITL